MPTPATVAPKPARPVVPALTLIEGHYRKFLNTRWIGLIVRAAVVTSAAFTFVPLLLMSSDYSVISFLGWFFLFGPFVYFFSVHPVLLVRRSLIMSPPVLPARPSSRAVLLGSFAAPIWGLYSAYLIFGVVFTLAYAFSLNVRNSAAALSWFNPTPRHKWQGNERLWFLVLGNTIFSLILALRDVFTAAFLPQWPRSRVRFPEAVRRSIMAYFGGFAPGTFTGDAANAATFTVVYSFIYFTFRRWAWRTVITYLPFLRPFVFNFAKSRTNITWSLSWHLLVIQISALLALEPALAVINDYLTQPLNFASFTSRSPLSPDRYLLTALESKNQFYVDHTIIELQRVAYSPQRRAALFADTSKPALIHTLWKTLLIQLGSTHTTLVNRGATQPANKKNAPPPIPALPDEHTIALKSGDVFRPAPKKTPIQNLVGHVLEGVPQPTPAPVLAVAESAHRAEVIVLQRVEAPAHAAEQWATRTPVLGTVLSTAKLIRGGYADWAGAEWARRNLFAAVPEHDRLARLVDILATLIVASADEDTYGYVQAVLPATLEALVRLRAAATRLGTDLVAQAPKVAPSVSEDTAAAVRSQTQVIVDVLEGGVLRVIERFGRTLQAFRFPNAIALALTDISKRAP